VVGLCLDKKEYEDLLSENQLIFAKRTAYAFASYKSRTKKEISDKLKTLDYSENIIELVVDFLIEFKLCDDRLYAKIFTRDKIKLNKWGPRKISQELSRRGIPANIVGDTLINEQENPLVKENAVYLAEKKLKSIKKNNYFQQKQKLYTFLSGKGYDSEIISEVCEDLLRE
jgi:regulatory protein